MGDALTLLLLATGGLLAIVILASVVDVLLGRLVAAGRISRPEIHLSIVVDAPIARAWELLSDIDRQPEWMHEMKQVTMLTPPPVGVGSRGRATVRIFGIGTTDEVVITRFEPPRTFAIRHEGHFVGEGEITLVALDRERTRVDWMEYLRPPLFGTLGGFLQRPILAAIFRSDLRSLRALLAR